MLLNDHFLSSHGHQTFHSPIIKLLSYVSEKHAANTSTFNVDIHSMVLESQFTKAHNTMSLMYYIFALTGATYSYND